MQPSQVNSEHSSLNSGAPRGKLTQAAKFQTKSSSPSSTKQTTPKCSNGGKNKSMETSGSGKKADSMNGKWHVPKPGVGSVTCNLEEHLEATSNGRVYDKPNVAHEEANRNGKMNAAYDNVKMNQQNQNPVNGKNKMIQHNETTKTVNTVHKEADDAKPTELGISAKIKKKRNKKKRDKLPATSPDPLIQAGNEILKLVNSGVNKNQNTPPTPSVDCSETPKIHQKKVVPSTPTISPGMEKLGLKQAEARLSRDYIFTLEKKSEDFPHAKFVCKLCNYHLDNVPLAHKHIKEKRHQKALKERQQDNILRELSLPSPPAINNLQKVLLTEVVAEVMSESDVQLRTNTVQDLEQLISTHIPKSRVVLYGSSCSGFGFTSSDVNVDLQYPSTMRAPAALLKVLSLLQDSETYQDVNADFLGKNPRINFTDQKSSLNISLSTGNESSILTSRLLRFYSLLDPRVIQLSMVFRKWAKMCRLDLQSEGSLPSHAFIIMTIFFMQRHKYIPALHEIIADHDMTSILNHSSISKCELLDFTSGSCHYTATLPPKQPSSPVKKPTPTEEDETDSDAETNTTLENCISESPDSNIELDSPLSGAQEPVKPSPIQPNNPVNLMGGLEGKQLLVADLWLAMIKFFALEYPMEDQIICICTSRTLLRSDKNWSRKRVAIVDPFSSKRNLCRSMTQQAVFGYMMSRLKAAVTYFYASRAQNDTPQVSCGNHDVNDNTPSTSNGGTGIEEQLDEVVPKICDMAIHSVLDEVAEDTTRYEFTNKVITGGHYPVKVCVLCKNEGHVRKDCPDEAKVMDLVELPPITKSLLNALDRVCNYMYENFALRQKEVQERNKICEALMNYIQRKYNFKCQMNLFGSSRNGFGFRRSDLDICMTFYGNATGEDLDFVSIITDVAKCLRRNSDLCNILPITTAKVPIVKFEHKMSGLEGDISLYNLLAQKNTAMLSCYSSIDCRCKVLGYAMKVFVKRCQIGDASRGSLSSYAYTLMVIFYLQQRKPPVLPVLQQLYEGSEQPVDTIDGWNAWFNSDVKALKDIWPEFGKNKESIGELWHNMLRFYTEEFDFRHHVVCIRKHEPLTVFEKEWTSKFISIEDPFDLNHNLGAGVSRKMSNFIMRVFVKARQHFANLPPKNMDPIHEPEYFFDANILMDGEEAPNDRCCRVCGKIGHFVRDCPRKKRRRGQDNGQQEVKDMNEYRCFLCGEFGHIKKDCPEYNNDSNFTGQNKFFRGSSPRNSDFQQRNFQSPKYKMSPHQNNKRNNSHTPGSRDTRRSSPPPHPSHRSNETRAKMNLFPPPAQERSIESSPRFVQSSPKQIPDKRRTPNKQWPSSPHTQQSPVYHQPPSASTQGYHGSPYNVIPYNNGVYGGSPYNTGMPDHGKDPHRDQMGNGTQYLNNPAMVQGRNRNMAYSPMHPLLSPMMNDGQQMSPGSRTPMGSSPHKQQRHHNRRNQK
uniref:terminal uridylyltransferase 4 isoform X1 n=1 Tax=Ciona intestinalis TaxID=7719 RepID=UPI0005218955|nr:terminal uridylyltransferase 4 isoform X1 [Ciona intestinalis]|eukprot:XP_009858669.1 terminal uridylyltransferase 4 isoform X1 [Ciona intestinalis]